MTSPRVQSTPGATTPAAPLSYESLTEMVDSGAIDTVVVAFSDLQGRLMGKRVVGRFFVDYVIGKEEGIEACDYLLTVDVEMNVVPGYRFSSWEGGYGDFRAVPDLSTLRLLPWLEATALVLCDVVDHHGRPVEVSPRRILQRQLERAAERDLSVMCGTELEFFLYRDTYEELAERDYRNPRTSSSYNLDYHVLQTTKDEPVIRTIRNQMIRAGLPIEFSKGEAAPGQHEINLRYAAALRMADHHTIYKNGCKEIAHALGAAITFMAKPTIEQPGSSCHIHTSIWSADETTPLCPGDDPTEMSPLFRSYLGGLLNHLADFSILGAPYVNSYKRYLPDSWAPTAVVWSPDNRTCGLRLVGAGPAMRVESRIPGADCNPYLAISGLVAAGLAGIEEGADCGDPFQGNAYVAEGLTRVPWNIADSIAAFRDSQVAIDAFGEEVHFHLLHTAEHEWKSFHATVTDWEWRRNFEQI